MSKIKLSNTIIKQIDKIVDFYKGEQHIFDSLANSVLINLFESEELKNNIHFTKIRSKDPEHLRDKLERIARQAIKVGEEFAITPDNVFVEIDDLAGVRLLHLHTKQMVKIHPLIIDMLKEHSYISTCKPIAYTWDDEYSQFFESIGIEVSSKDSMYTSVHYIVKPKRLTEMRCEIQVRTLVEEVWGEVSHKINYPHKTQRLSCQEQLRVLARATSTCTRLVDSIFVAYHEYEKRVKKSKKTKKKVKKKKKKTKKKS